jgi:hypothetical protein
LLWSHLFFYIFLFDTYSSTSSRVPFPCEIPPNRNQTMVAHQARLSFPSLTSLPLSILGTLFPKEIEKSSKVLHTLACRCPRPMPSWCDSSLSVFPPARFFPLGQLCVVSAIVAIPFLSFCSIFFSVFVKRITLSFSFFSLFLFLFLSGLVF